MITREQWDKIKVGDILISAGGKERKVTKINGAYIFFKPITYASGKEAAYLYSDIRKTYSIKESDTGKCFLVQDNIYGRQTMFCVGVTMDVFEKQFQKIFNTTTEYMPNKSSYEDFFDSISNQGRVIFKNNVCVVLLKSADLPFIVHELFHVVEAHFEKIGLPHGDSSSEAWAYYLQFLMENFIKNYKL